MFTPTVGEVEQESSGSTGSSSAWQEVAQQNTVVNEPEALASTLLDSKPTWQTTASESVACVFYSGKNTLDGLYLAQVTEAWLEVCTFKYRWCYCVGEKTSLRKMPHNLYQT